jgi:hypothetical protein
VNITLELPEDIAHHLAAEWGDLNRAALIDIGLEGCRARKLRSKQRWRVRGFAAHFHLNGFLKQRQVWLEHTAQDLERDREAHKRLGPQEFVGDRFRRT